MNIKRNLLVIIHFCLSFSTILTGFVVTCILMTLNVWLIWPFSKRLYRRVQYYLQQTMVSQSVFYFTWWCTSDLNVYANRDEYEMYLGKEHSFCVVNHISEIDWIVLIRFFDDINIAANTKFYVKKDMKYVPMLGWGFYCSDFIYLSRCYEKDKDILKKSVAEFVTYEDPVNIVLYPEGSRFTTERHKQSLRFSKERGLPDLHHHLMPRTKGFSTSVPLMRDKIKTIYNIQIAFEGTEPTISNVFLAKHITAHLYIDRIPMEDVPNGEEELKQYLREMFYKKDKMMDSFKKTGDFFKLSGVQRKAPIVHKRHRRNLHNFCVCFILSVIFVHYISLKLYLNGYYFCLSSFLGLLTFGIAVVYSCVYMAHRRYENQTSEK